MLLIHFASRRGGMKPDLLFRHGFHQVIAERRVADDPAIGVTGHQVDPDTGLRMRVDRGLHSEVTLGEQADIQFEGGEVGHEVARRFKAANLKLLGEGGDTLVLRGPFWKGGEFQLEGRDRGGRIGGESLEDLLDHFQLGPHEQPERDDGSHEKQDESHDQPADNHQKRLHTGSSWNSGCGVSERRAGGGLDRGLPATDPSQGRLASFPARLAATRHHAVYRVWWAADFLSGKSLPSASKRLFLFAPPAPYNRYNRVWAVGLVRLSG